MQRFIRAAPLLAAAAMATHADDQDLPRPAPKKPAKPCKSPAARRLSPEAPKAQESAQTTAPPALSAHPSPAQRLSRPEPARKEKLERAGSLHQALKPGGKEPRQLFQRTAAAEAQQVQCRSLQYYSNCSAHLDLFSEYVLSGFSLCNMPLTAQALRTEEPLDWCRTAGGAAASALKGRSLGAAARNWNSLSGGPQPRSRASPLGFPAWRATTHPHSPTTLRSPRCLPAESSRRKKFLW